MTEPTSYRVTLPVDARRPFQIVSIPGHPTPLTFDASREEAIPKPKRRAQTLPEKTVRQFLGSQGGVARMWLQDAVEGALELSAVPAKLWPEMTRRAEVTLPSRAKSLRLTPSQMADLRALGFQVETETESPPREETDHAAD